jgi:hypothetical protein
MHGNQDRRPRRHRSLGDPADELARLSDDIISALKTVYDPEIPADILNSA